MGRRIYVTRFRTHFIVKVVGLPACLVHGILQGKLVQVWKYCYCSYSMAFGKTTEPNIGNRDGGGEVMSNAEGTKLAKDMDYGCILCRMDCFRHEERVLGGRPPAGCEMHTSATRPVAPPGRKFQQMSYMSQMSQMTAKHTVQVVAPPKTSHILSYSSSGGRPPAGCEMHTPATRPAFMM